MKDTSKMIGENGTVLIDSTASLSSEFYQIYIQEDSIIASLEEKNENTGSPVDVMTEQNLTAKTIKAGVILTPNREFFSSFSFTSGSGIGYKL